MPDKILIMKGSKVGAINYNDIKIAIKATRFIESGKLPQDAKVVDYTWEYVNKNGTPDKRYKNNRQLPICNYGEITIPSKPGLNIILNCSSLNNTNKFKKIINKENGAV